MLRSRLCVPIRPVVLSCQGCSVKCPINIALSPFLHSLVLQKLVHHPHKLISLLNLRTVSAVVQHNELRTRNSPVVGFACTQGHNAILAPPHDEGRELAQAAQGVRQTRVMHIRPPPHETRQFARRLPALRLFRCWITTVQLLGLCCALRISKTGAHVFPAHHQEHVKNLAHWWSYSHGPYQYQTLKLLGTHSGHLSGKPATEGTTNHRHLAQAQLVQGIEIPER